MKKVEGRISVLNWKRELIWTSVLLIIAGCSPDNNEEKEISETVDDNNTVEENTPEESEEEPEEENVPEEEDETEEEYSYGVSAGHPAAVDAGMSVLEDGGTAVDAAIAAAFAVSVVEPFASGIGGGGSALVHEQGENPQAYDYREVVPEEGIPASDTGVPGFTAGMAELHEDYGSTAWETLLDPAVSAAESTEVSELLAQQFVSGQSRLPVDQLPHFYPGGNPLNAGETLEQEELAETLQTIQQEGPDAFYEGAVGEALTENIEGMDQDSLGSYEVGRHDPVQGEVFGYEVIGAAPPLPGMSVIQMLQIMEEKGAGEVERTSTEFIHTGAMAWRAAFQYLETDAGDPDFVDVPVEEVTDPERNAELAEEISEDSLLEVNESESYGGIDPNTTHINVVDSEGTIVSMTNTLTNFWGSGEYTSGFFLNNQMARFSIGRGENNEPEPGRRSITWSSPMLLADEEGPVLGIGTPGGERIPLMLTQVITDWSSGETSMEEAVEAPRFHLDGSDLIFEEMPGTEQQEALRSIGYAEIREQPTPLYFGSIQMLGINREREDIEGGVDARRESTWRSESSEE
jgi:gamma-glutamyltranspeptidase / glutathione hydrolase